MVVTTAKATFILCNSISKHTIENVINLDIHCETTAKLYYHLLIEKLNLNTCYMLDYYLGTRGAWVGRAININISPGKKY